MIPIQQDKMIVLAVNSGSSSLKCGLFEGVARGDNSHSHGEEPSVLFSAVVENLGAATSRLQIKDGSGRTRAEESRAIHSASEALAWGTERLMSFCQVRPSAAGHRIVHGGATLLDHQQITPAVIETLERSVHIAPLHIPQALDLIHGVAKLFPAMPQFACFDTAFHRTMPETASHFALPQSLWNEGIRRYGFHGLSYESIVRLLESDLKPRTVVAHLGNGSSLAALANGQSVDTSMGFTPTAGIPMGTRSGDLDPGVLLYMIRHGFDADRLEGVLNHESGLAGLSGGVSDMRSLQSASQAGSPGAQLAIEVFARSIRKTIAAYAAVLGGLDLVVFAGGIGENSREVRECALSNLLFLGIELDGERNARGEAVISAASSRCEVRIVKTDEDGQIARHTLRLYSLS